MEINNSQLKGHFVKQKVKRLKKIKTRIQHGCFSVKFAKFLRTSFFTEHLWRLLLLYNTSNILDLITLADDNNFFHLINNQHTLLYNLGGASSHCRNYISKKHWFALPCKTFTCIYNYADIARASTYRKQFTSIKNMKHLLSLMQKN